MLMLALNVLAVLFLLWVAIAVLNGALALVAVIATRRARAKHEEEDRLFRARIGLDPDRD